METSRDSQDALAHRGLPRRSRTTLPVQLALPSTTLTLARVVLSFSLFLAVIFAFRPTSVFPILPSSLFATRIVCALTALVKQSSDLIRTKSVAGDLLRRVRGILRGRVSLVVYRRRLAASSARWRGQRDAHAGLWRGRGVSFYVRRLPL